MARDFVEGELKVGEFIVSKTAVRMKTLLLGTSSIDSAAAIGSFPNILALRGMIRNDLSHRFRSWAPAFGKAAAPDFGGIHRLAS